MTTSILFEAPGPKTRRRHQIYTAVGGALVLAVVAWFIWLLNDQGEFEYDLWEPFLTPEFLEVLLVDGLLNTLRMAAISIALAIVLGMLLGVGKLSEHALVRWPCWVLVEFFRAVPLLLLMIFIYYRFGTGADGIGNYWSLVAALTLYNGAVLAEIFRAGVLAVPTGQSEAAYALGMRKTQVMITVLLPQAIKIMIPAIISQIVVCLKDTSLGYYIGAAGFSTVGRQVWTEFGNQLQTATFLAVGYIGVNLILTWLATKAQRRLVGETSPLDVTRVGTADGTQKMGAGGGIGI